MFLGDSASSDGAHMCMDGEDCAPVGAVCTGFYARGKNTQAP